MSENFDIKLESINVLLSQLVKKNMILKTDEMGVSSYGGKYLEPAGQ